MTLQTGTMRQLLLLSLFASLALASCGKSDNGISGGGTGADGPAAGAAPPSGKQWSEIVERTGEGGWRMGNPDAPVKLIEYGSRSCSHCAAFAARGEPILRAQYVEPGKVSYEFRDMLSNPFDVVGMLVGECAGADQFFPILAEMFAAQDQLRSLAREEYLTPTPGMSVGQHAVMIAEKMGYADFARRRGVSAEATRKCLSDSARIEEAEKRLRLAREKYDIRLTPSFIVNGSKVEAGNWQQLEPYLAGAGA